MSGASQSTGFDAARLVRDHQAGVWRYLRALGCDGELASDLTQDTFLAVLRRPFQQYSPAATAAYLRRVARNLLVTQRRRAGLPVIPAELDQLESRWVELVGDEDGERIAAALQNCLEELTPRAQQALRQRYSHAKSRAEIAAGLHLSEHGAKNLMQRAKKVLKKCIERRVQTRD